MVVMQRNLEKFLKKYNAQIKTSNTRFYKNTPFRVTMEKDSMSHNVEITQGVDITISEYDLNYLVEQHEAIERMLHREHQYADIGLAHRIVNAQEREIKLRNYYPQLRELYEQYITLLRIVDDGGS